MYNHLDAISRALADRSEEVAHALLGEPSSANRREWRWGRRGSLSLSRSGDSRGRWYDHERGEGGDLLDLIARTRKIPLSQSLLIAIELLRTSARVPVSQSHLPARDHYGANERIAPALQLWRESVPICGSLGERYFVEHRKLAIGSLALDHAVRWHPRVRAVVALMTHPVTGAHVGVHRTFLDASGAKTGRKMLGRQGVIRLPPDDEVTGGLGVTEGLEDGIAVLLSGWRPVWCATSAGAIARFPVVSGIEAITVFADADEAGLKAAATCCDHWRSAGREARIVSPRAA
jgi:putative DNA primase/helicase